MLRNAVTLLFLIICVGAVDWDVITDLDQYVHSDDGHFEWHEVASYRFEGVTLYILNMTSQLYQTEEFSTRPIWWHYVGIAIPDNLRSLEFGTLAITGGSNNDYEPPPHFDPLGLLTSRLANDSGLITGYIAQIPNQPTYFYNDPTFRRRTEDSLIAWTWRTFMDSPEPSDPTVIERMPMTKASKRALDTIHEYARIRVPGSNIQKFAVTGASKRGWTVWSLAAVDKRVACMIPLVFSMINIDGGTILQHNQNMDGGWSFAFEPYWRENLTQELYNPKVSRLWDVEDAYRYKERFTQPLLAMSSSGDEFFLLDDNHHWWNDIPDPKWLMMLPNAEHVMAPHYLQIYETLLSFIVSVVDDIPIPKVTWTLSNAADGGPAVSFNTEFPPRNITAYTATTLPTDERRDFRLFSLEPGAEDVAGHRVFWRHNITVHDMENGNFHAEVELVEGEWTGLFLEGEWEGPTGHRMVFTSQVNIAPNTYPRPPCADNESCYGYLV